MTVTWGREVSGFFIFFLLHSFYFSALKNYFSPYQFCSKRGHIEIKIVKMMKDGAHADYTTKRMAHSHTICRHCHQPSPEDSDLFSVNRKLFIFFPWGAWLLRNLIPLSKWLLVGGHHCHVLSRSRITLLAMNKGKPSF